MIIFNKSKYFKRTIKNYLDTTTKYYWNFIYENHRGDQCINKHYFLLGGETKKQIIIYLSYWKGTSKDISKRNYIRELKFIDKDILKRYDY